MSYKVLVFGQKLLNQANSKLIDNKNANITFSNFPNDKSQLQSLGKFDVIICPFRTFYYSATHYKDDEKIFRKSIIQAVNKGTYFCFLHYNDFISSNNLEKNFGAKIVQKRKIEPKHSNKIFINGKQKLNIFSPYLKKWGATHNYFVIDTPKSDDDIIYESDGKVLGFSFRKSKGQFIFLPFQQNKGDKNNNARGLKKLIDTLLNYKSKKDIKIPEWAEKPFFKEETNIQKEIDEHEKTLDDLKDNLSIFTFAKSLLTSREYDLEDKIPTFFEEHLDLNTYRDETFSEDFWILNNEEDPIIICEIKSRMKDFKKSSIYKLFNHREENGKDEDFPGLLIVNHHIQAGSWKDKDRKIDKKDYKTASEDNILIVRVEDLVRIWDGIRNDKISENIPELFKNNSGWLEITKKFNINIHA